MECRLVDRRVELEALNRAYRKRPGLMVVYGRRRVGKTRLIREWLSGFVEGKSVYSLAHLAGHTYNLRMMAERAGAQLGDPLLAELAPDRLDVLLELLARAGVEVVVIDEFTYWARSSPRVLSELQVFVDERLESTGLLVVISGSLIGVLERAVLGGGSPLYARARWRLRLSPMGFEWLRGFVPQMTPEDRVRLYALVGGVPFYLCLAREASSLEDVVDMLFLDPAAPLGYEKDLLLREELREPHTYNSILSAIARGYDTPSRIAQVTGLEPGHVHKYLSVLESLGMVERETPLFRRRGRYRIADPILRTWYTLLEPVNDLIELGRQEEARRAILSRMDEYTAPTWEHLVKAHLTRLLAGEGYTLAGRLEHRGEEVDVALVNPEEKRAVVAEAKWSTLAPQEASRIRRRTLAKAARLLPRGYTVEEAFVAARNIAGGTRPPWTITPEDLEEHAKP